MNGLPGLLAANPDVFVGIPLPAFATDGGARKGVLDRNL